MKIMSPMKVIVQAETMIASRWLKRIFVVEVRKLRYVREDQVFLLIQSM